MNNKRQTIWLVSMLSLMVILSAYYLFSDGTKDLNMQSVVRNPNQGKPTELDPKDPNGIQITQVDDKEQSEQKQEKKQKTNRSAPSTKDKKEKNTVNQEQLDKDQEVLNGLGNSKGFEQLEKLSYEQQVKNSKKSEELGRVVSNAKSSQEEATTAAEALDRLTDLDARMTSLQEKLLQDFENAVVTEDSSRFNVIVLSKKLNKKQAINIVDLTTKELEVKPSQVTVQYVQ